MSVAKGIIVEIGGDTTKLQQALKNANSSITSLSKELRGVNTLLNMNPDSGILNKQKYTVIQEEIEATTKKLEQLKKVQELADENNNIDKNSKNYRELQREIELTQTKLSQLKAEASNWTKAGETIQQFGNKITTLGEKGEKVGKTLTATLTTTIVGIGTASAKSAIDFESAFTGVEKTVDGTTEQLSNLRQGILDMSKEIPSSAVEISAVAEAAGQLGIKTEDILSFTRVMIDLGNSTNLSAEEAASSLAKFANITGMSADKYSNLGAVIADLGNNFATTEADIVSMATYLASTGELTGLTEAQIMALATAMSSVGIEAEAGGSTMSKLLKKIQVAVETGSDSLNDFSKVANMTSSEFKQAFEKDAVGALSAFIAGLNDTERNGQSAISILNDMGLTEVRLSNTILGLANSSDVMQNAITTANKAWDENTALTNEATKRYETFESKLETTKNKATALGIKIGEKLLPELGKIIDSVDGLIDKFDSLSDEEKDNIIKIAKFAAAVGPATLVVSKLTKTIGTGITFLGNFSKAIGNVKNGVTTAEGTVGKMTKAIVTMNSGLGIMIVTAGAAYGAMKALDNYRSGGLKETYQDIKNINTAIEEQKTAREELQKQQIENLSSNLSEMENTQKLADELRGIVDENGKIKDGYETRANFILNELNNALGTEYSSVNGVIQQYQNLQDEIDNLILKKKAQIILDSKEELYAEAIKNQTTALNEMNKAQENLNTVTAEYESAKNSLNKSIFDGEKEQELKLAVEVASDAYNEAKELYEGYFNDIVSYETDAQRVLEGSSESLQEVVSGITSAYVENGKTINAELKKQIKLQTSMLEQDKQIYAEKVKTATEAEKQVYEARIKSDEEQLQSTIDTLVAQTSTISNSQEVIDAWKSLAENSRIAYNERVSQMPTDLRQKVEEMTGVIAVDGETVIENAGMLGKNMAQALDSSNTASESGNNTVQAYFNGGVNNSEFKNQITTASSDLGIEAAKKLDASEESRRSSTNFLLGFKNNIDNSSARSSLLSSVSSLTRSIVSVFNRGLDEHSPSKESEKSAENYLIGFVKGIIKNKNSTLNEVANLSSEINDSFANGLYQSNLNSKINSSVKNIFTTPQMVFYVQEMNEQNLDKAFNYVNRRLGSKY